MSPIFVADCDCASLLEACRKDQIPVERFNTDELACEAALAHWIRRLQAIQSPHRYWCVHGPSGHLIGIRDIPRAVVESIERALGFPIGSNLPPSA